MGKERDEKRSGGTGGENDGRTGGEVVGLPSLELALGTLSGACEAVRAGRHGAVAARSPRRPFLGQARVVSKQTPGPGSAPGFGASCQHRSLSSLDFSLNLSADLPFAWRMASLRVLVIGGGGREHALAWKLAQSPRVDRIFVCPGNGGTSLEPKTVNVDLSPSDFPALVEFAVKNEVRGIPSLRPSR